MTGKLRNFIVSLALSLTLCGCNFFDEVVNEKEATDYDSLVTSVKLSASTLTVDSGESEYISLALQPAGNQGKCHVSWEYDSDMVLAQTDNFGAVITGIMGGTTFIKAKCNGIVATCMITVNPGAEENLADPYIYSNFSVVELQPGDTTTISSSLYGGSVSDMEFFGWEIKDSSVAEISYSRNNCVITAKKPGSTQVICSHPDSKYPYSFVIYVYTDKMTETYITTDYNIVTINKNEVSSKTISVDLVNPVNAAYKNGFHWNYSDEESREIISLSANLSDATITPLKNGIARLTVTHENSQYPLDIIVRVNTIVKNTYIGLSQSSLIIDGSDTPYTVNATIENYDGYADNEKFEWKFPEGAEELLDWTASGNSLRISGKKNGSVKVKVSHELSEYSRSLLVILQNQAGSAVDASMYITTTQNFVQTQVGKDAVTVSVTLVGGQEGTDNIGDEKTNFSWWIKGGRDNGIVEVQDVTGVVRDLSSRSAVSSGDFCSATLSIAAKKEGTAQIIVTHPRCLYDTEIQVKVYAKDAIVNPLTINTDESLIKLVNGDSKEIKAQLKNASAGDENNVQWSSANPNKVSVSPATGERTVLGTFPQTGNGQTYITAHLDGALSDKKILVLTADTQEALDSMKYIVADSTYLRISGGETKEIMVEGFGLKSGDMISWTTSDSSVCTVSSGGTNHCTAQVTALSGVTEAEGKKATITASLADCEPVVFEVTVLPVGQSSEIFDESAGYLTTNLNAIVLENIGDTAGLSVTGVNIPDSSMRLNTKWSMNDINAVEDDPVFDLAGSPGSDVTLTALKKGKSGIIVKNKDSLNTISINAKCGEIYEWTDDYIVYITAENDVVNIINGQTTTIGCSLVNTTSGGSFSWQVTQGNDNIEITGLTSGTCTITGKQAGQSIITVSNTLAGEITKEILVNVANTEEELKGFKYLTTEQNVITVGEQSNTSVSVTIKNADGNILTGFSWRSTNENVASVVGSGSVAVVYGKGIGTAKIIVENNDYCSYPLEIICNVVDPVAVSEDPYISCNNIVTCTVGTDPVLVAAELIGGTASDAQSFAWSVVDNNIATLYASNDSAQIKALTEGVTQVIVTHPKASVPRTILVICEPKIVTNCYISLTESIIKMSPNDDPRTITASLVNGDDDDVYDFKWWADSYDKIDMNYTGEACLIQPIASGVVTVHVSHPKAKNQKDIVLYISNYTDFAFSTTYAELTTGTSSTFIPMEVPATGVDCLVSYSSDKEDVCQVFGNNSVCTLTPGTLKDVSQGESKTCTVTATLLTKGGVKQAEAKLLVSVTKKRETDPYIALIPDNLSTIITMNKGEKRNLEAKIYGTVADTTFAGLTWEINSDAQNLLSFVGRKNTGANIQLEALNSGKAVITVRHGSGEVKNPLTLYVIVSGESDPTVSLNYEEISLYLGEEAQALTATVQNDDGKPVSWEFVNDDDPSSDVECIIHTEKGNKCSVLPDKVGNATVIATLESGSRAECKVHVLEAEKINFFIYDNEGDYDTDENGNITNDRRNKKYIKELMLYPGETKPLHYECVPPKDGIKSWYRSDNNFFTVDSGTYDTIWKDPDDGKSYHYPDGIGTVSLTGKTNQGTAMLKVTSDSNQSAMVSITNSYGYMFTTSKSIISSTPKLVHDDPRILYVDYEIRPAHAKIYVTVTTPGEAGNHLSLTSNYSNYDQNQRQWIVETHTITNETSETGIAKGTLKFMVDGETNCTVNLEPINDKIVSSGTSSETKESFCSTKVSFQVFYPSHTFKPVITRKVPNLNEGFYGKSTSVAKYSYFYNTSNAFFLGDGERLEGTVYLSDDEPYSKVQISEVVFESSGSATILDGYGTSQETKGVTQNVYVGGRNQGDSFNSHSFTLYHEMDYGLLNFKTDSGNWELHKKFYRLSSDSMNGLTENFNETVKETTLAGYLCVKYFNYAAGGGTATYKFPVFVQVRGCPCAEVSGLYELKNTWY